MIKVKKILLLLGLFCLQQQAGIAASEIPTAVGDGLASELQEHKPLTAASPLVSSEAVALQEQQRPSAAISHLAIPEDLDNDDAIVLQKGRSPLVTHLFQDDMTEEEWAALYENSSDQRRIMGPICATAALTGMKALSEQNIFVFMMYVSFSAELADLATGLSHTALNRLDFEDKSLPFAVRRLVKTEQWHNDNPESIKDWSFWRLSRDAYSFLSPALIFPILLTYLDCDPLAFISALTIFFIANSNVIHAYCHGKWSDSIPLQTLESVRMIPSKKAHQAYHEDPAHDTNPCSLTGHMNGPLKYLSSKAQDLYAAFSRGVSARLGSKLGAQSNAAKLKKAE